MHEQRFMGPATHSNRGGCCCCFLYPVNKMILGWYFIHFNLGKDQKKLCKFCSSPLKLKQLRFRSKKGGPGSNESRFPQPSTWVTPRRSWCHSDPQLSPLFHGDQVPPDIYIVLYSLENTVNIWCFQLISREDREGLLVLSFFIWNSWGSEMWLAHGYTANE